MVRKARKKPDPDPTRVPRVANSLVQVRVGNHTYDAVHVPGCHTCTHPARMLIEERIVQGQSYRSIADWFSGKEIEVADGKRELMPTIGYMSIRNHFLANHMPMEQATLRRLSERRAVQLGANLEDPSTELVNQYTLAEAVVHKTYTRLATGEIEPEVKDGLTAAKFMQEVEERQAGGFDAEAWSQAMTVYFEAARAVMPNTMWDQFTTRLAVNPILRAIEQKLNPQTDEDDDVVDAEIVRQGD